MTQPSVFVQIESRDKTNPIAMAIAMIAKASNAVIVDKLVNEDEIEADIAIVNSVEAALRATKETEHTIVFLTYFDKSQEAESRALAARLPERVKAGPLVEREGEENVATALMRTIVEMGKEEKR